MVRHFLYPAHSKVSVLRVFQSRASNPEGIHDSQRKIRSFVSFVPPARDLSHLTFPGYPALRPERVVKEEYHKLGHDGGEISVQLIYRLLQAPTLAIAGDI
jgi:hypothetical protein